jgi:hypothetical protein
MQTSRHMEGEDMERSALMADFSVVAESRHVDMQTPELPGSDLGVEASRHTDTQTSRHADVYVSTPLEDEPTIKRSTFRLEADLIDRLHAFCRQQGLSREVLIEAMYEYMEAHPEALAQVVEQAHQKHDHRQQLANRKRAEAMFSKFGRNA